MLRMHRYVGLSVLLLLISLSFWALASCGGGGGGGGTPLTGPEKAAASASAAQGAVALSASVAGAADMAYGYIPGGYAPGKGGLQAGTAAIANIDPRLKDVVDKMLVQMQRPAIKTALSKAGTFSKVLSAAAITSSATYSCISGGNYVVNDSMTSVGTTTTHTLTVQYNACKDDFFPNKIDGLISATHSINAITTSESATVTITNLSDKTYTDANYTQVSEKFVLNGTFTSASTGNPLSSSSGTASALGAFTWTMFEPGYGSVVMGFNFGNSGTPITDTWTKVVSGPDMTDTHTANGHYGLTVNAPGQSVILSIALTDMVDTFLTNASGTDESINGSITIGWSPDLSQWGCLNGTYNFTTTTPVHTDFGAYCPTSGFVQVNNATIAFGTPSGSKVTVTLLPSGPSQVFADCMSMDGGGMCSSGGTAAVPVM